MTNKAFQRIYTQLEAITKATVSLRAQGVSNDELATVAGRLAQVVKIKDDLVTLQVYEGTEGIPTDAEVTFFGEPPALNVSDELAGRFFDAYGHPIDGGPEVEGERRYIGGPSVNPYKRKQPSQLIPTGIAGIDLNNVFQEHVRECRSPEQDHQFRQYYRAAPRGASADTGHGPDGRRVFCRGQE